MTSHLVLIIHPLCHQALTGEHCVPFCVILWLSPRLYCIMYQVYHNTLPDQLTALFETRNSDNNDNLRRSITFPHVRYNSNLGRISVRYRGPIVWNLIPKAIKDASSQQLFKVKLRQASRILDHIQFEKEAYVITSKQTDFIYF